MKSKRHILFLTCSSSGYSQRNFASARTLGIRGCSLWLFDTTRGNLFCDCGISFVYTKLVHARINYPEYLKPTAIKRSYRYQSLLPLDVAPERRTMTSTPEISDTGSLIPYTELQIPVDLRPYIGLRFGRERDKCGPKDHLRHIPFIHLSLFTT